MSIFRCSGYCDNPIPEDEAAASCGDHRVVCGPCVDDGWPADTCRACELDQRERLGDDVDDLRWEDHQDRIAAALEERESA